MLATEAEAGDLAAVALRAVAAGRRRHNEIAQAVGADPSRVPERLVKLRLLERVVPVTETGSRTRQRSYRIADDFPAFWLGVVDRRRTAIERGPGRTVLPVHMQHLDDHLGPRCQQATRRPHPPGGRR